MTKKANARRTDSNLTNMFETRVPDFATRCQTKIGSTVMKKNPPVLQLPNQKTVSQPHDRHWHNGGDIEIGFYARSLHRAAKSLVASLDLQPNPKTAWDACPVVLLYRQSVELHLKAL